MSYKAITCTICGALVCAHLAHEVHEEKDVVLRALSAKPSVKQPFYGRHRHGEEPESPSGPLRMAQTVAVASISAVYAPLILGSPGDLMWNQEAGTLTWPPTDPSSGST